jgi:pimeloyl-ACP methyl ester carboxylesterase
MQSLAAGNDVEEGELSLIGLGLGGTIALLAAQEPGLAARIPVVVAIAPVTDFIEIGRLATTGFHRVEGGFIEQPVPLEIRITAANAVLEALPGNATRRIIKRELEATEDGQDPLARLHEIPRDLLDRDTRAVVQFLANKDPRKYDRLFANLPAPVQDAVRDLSPVVDAQRLRARVELAVSANDLYVPLAQARALEQVAPNVHVTVSDAFSSTQTRPTIGGPGDFLRLDAMIVRALHEAHAS